MDTLKAQDYPPSLYKEDNNPVRTWLDRDKTKNVKHPLPRSISLESDFSDIKSAIISEINKISHTYIWLRALRLYMINHKVQELTTTEFTEFMKKRIVTRNKQTMLHALDILKSNDHILIRQMILTL